MSDTIERLLVTFVDIIYSSDQEWTEAEILQRLHDKKYFVSQSQLNRDLNRYHGFFSVERLDKYNSDNQVPVYRRIQSKVTEAVMSQGEIQFLTAILGIKEQLEQYLPPEAQMYLDARLARMNKQRVRLLRNVPQHPLFKFENNLQLIRQHEIAGTIPAGILAEIRLGLTKQQELQLSSAEFGDNASDIFSPLRVYENQGQLFVSGMSALEGGTNRDYCVSKLVSVQSVAAQPPAPHLSASRR